MEGWGEPLEGVRLHPLTGQPDHRGTLTEIFRESWSTGIEVEGWEMLSTEPEALWGVHLHAWSDRYLVLLQGRATAGLCDLRGRPLGPRGSTVVELSGEARLALIIPRGIAHGLYFHEPSVLVIAASRGRRPGDGLGCAWNDPGLQIPWPSTHARLSPRDAALPPLADLQQALAAMNPSYPDDVT
jgi:dTDP-4-dehydrorhamnose 3,5-epimerase